MPDMMNVKMQKPIRVRNLVEAKNSIFILRYRRMVYDLQVQQGLKGEGCGREGRQK